MGISQKLRISGFPGDSAKQGPLSKAKYAHRKSCDGIREYEKEKISKVSLIKVQK